MKNLIYSLVFVIFGIFIFVDCQHKEPPALASVEKSNYDSILTKEEIERMKTATSIKFDKEVYDFGECKEGDKITKTIEFTNSGKLPLVINQAYGSCGCTVPKYNKEPVAPGERGQLEIHFDSKHKAGANTKSVMIEANTNPPITTISFNIKVNENSKKKKGWFN